MTVSPAAAHVLELQKFVFEFVGKTDQGVNRPLFRFGLKTIDDSIRNKIGLVTFTFKVNITIIRR